MHGTFLCFADEVSVITLRLGTLQSSAPRVCYEAIEHSFVTSELIYQAK
jgi:hypothetical protein